MTNAPVLDLLIRLKNASLAGKKSIKVPSSKFKKSVVDLLKSNNFVDSYNEAEVDNKKQLHINLKYTNRQPAISDIKIFSKPGRRLFERADSLPWSSYDEAIIIISTSKGLRTQRQAQKENLGGEVIAQVM